METVKKEILVALNRKLDDATNPLPYAALQALCSLFGLSAKQSREKLKESLGEFLTSNANADLSITLEDDRDEKSLLFLRNAYEQGVLNLGVVEKVVVPEPEPVKKPEPEETKPAELPVREIKSLVAPETPEVAEYKHQGLKMSAIPTKWHRFVSRLSPELVERIRKSVASNLFVGQHVNGSRVTGTDREKMVGDSTGIAFFWNDVV